MRYTAENFARLINGKCHSNFDGDKILSSVISDSRKICDDSSMLFVALRGDRFDGHDFVSEITKNGNHFALIEDESFLCRNSIYVPDVRKALYDLAKKHRETTLADKKCVTITGSVGKTSTKEFVSAVFSQGWSVYKSPGNMNSYTGLPMVILNCDENAEYMVLEAGMNTRGEISTLSQLIKPQIGIITNIGWSHSEYLGGRKNIFEEKLDITVGMTDGVLVVNGDDDLLASEINRGCTVVRCSLNNPESEFYCTDVNDENGILTFKINGKKAFIRQKGIHNVRNALLAYAAGVISGLSHEAAAEGISTLTDKESRIKIYKGKNQCTVIEDCYNAAPESMKAALDCLRNQKGERIAVLGDMLELGDFAYELHKEVGEYAKNCCDKLFCFGELGRFIGEGASSAGLSDVRFFNSESREELINTIQKETNENVSILFKASNRMRFGEVIKSANLI